MINTVGYYIDQAIRDGLLTPDEISSINNLAAGTVTSAEIDNLLTQAQAGRARGPIQPAAFHFAAREPDAGRVLKGNAQVDVAVIDRSSLDLVDSKLDSNGYTLTFKDGSQLFLEEIEFVQFTDLLIRFDPSNNVSQLPSNDLLVVAANYQFFTGRSPTAGGCE